MTFPYYFHIFGHAIHPHLVLEASAYVLGFGLHTLIRRKLRVPKIDPQGRLWLIAGLVVGALVGAHLVALGDASESTSYAAAILGKSIVGAILGGWIGTEIAKRANHITYSTGDTWAIPLLASIALGRVGCFLTGLSDHTYGIPSNIIWAVDFGDGISRHPTQLYESFFCLGMIPLFGLFTALCARRPGGVFRLFIIVYMLFRFAIEFIKPTPKPVFGLSILQLIALAAAMYAAVELFRIPRTSPEPVQPVAD